VSNPPTTPEGLYSDLATFAFNFLVLISVWMRYTRVMSVLPIENRSTSLLNTMLLFTVSVEPFLFNILRSVNGAAPAEGTLLESATSLYGGDLGAMMLIMGIFTLTLADEERKLVPTEIVSELRIEAVTWFSCSGLFLVSALPIIGILVVGGQSLRTVFWLLALGVVWVGRAFRRMQAT
jgi:uncharacterized membrane protein